MPGSPVRWPRPSTNRPYARSSGSGPARAFDQAAHLAGDPQQTKAARQAVGQLEQAIVSDAPLEPLITAVTGVVVTTRDAAVSQLDTRALPKTQVRADVALVLPHLLAYGQSRVADTQLGALVTPLLSAGSARVAAVAVPVVVVAGLLAVTLGALQVILLRRRSGAGGSIESES